MAWRWRSNNLINIMANINGVSMKENDISADTAISWRERKRWQSVEEIK
jgi:hypothetical protein